MRDTKRALTLKIDANSPEDMVMLLRQALYEIEQFLPAAVHGATQERLSPRSGAAVVAKPGDDELVSSGFSRGSIGSYEFEFFHTSRLYRELEQALLAQGYARRLREGLLAADWEYHHPSLPTKRIVGDPPRLQDKV